MKITITEVPSEKKVIGTQVSPEMYNKLKEEAEENFMSISDLLRKIIAYYYRKN